MKINENTSMDPRVYEVVQELIDDLAQNCGDVQGTRGKLDGVLTALYALTGEIWTRERLDGLRFYYVANENDTERIVPSCLNFMRKGFEIEKEA